MTDILNNLDIARNAALEAGNMLLNFKGDLNKETISSSPKSFNLTVILTEQKYQKLYLNNIL